MCIEEHHGAGDARAASRASRRITEDEIRKVAHVDTTTRCVHVQGDGATPMEVVCEKATSMSVARARSRTLVLLTPVTIRAGIVGRGR